MVNRERATKLLDLAMELEREGKTDEAINVYLKAIDIDPTWAVPCYNVGLMYKYRGDWRKSLIYNEKSAFLDPSDKPSVWNMAIAATALKDWKTARKTWRMFGIPLPIGDENSELRMEIGMTPIRLKVNNEVIWTNRIDPARAIINNVPTPDSKRRFKDIVLNDGAPNGTRIYNKRQFHVFDELELFESSGYSTFTAMVHVKNEASLKTLEDTLDNRGDGFENWTDSIRHVCEQCSRGTPHEHHDKKMPRTIPNGQYLLGLAAKSEADLKNILTKWGATTQSKVLDFEKVF